AAATQYMLWLDDSTAGVSRHSHTATQAGCASGTGTCTVAPGIVLTSGAGQWWIVTANASGNGPWSTAMAFTVPGAPPPEVATLVAPAGKIGRASRRVSG